MIGGNFAQLVSPYLGSGSAAGESASGASERTFTSSYTIASATGGYQDGLAVEVSIGCSSNRAGGNLVFRHVDGGLEIGTMWVPSDATSADTVANWLSLRIAGPLDGGLWDASVPHTIKTVVHFVDDGPDQTELWVDGQLTDVLSSWEQYHRLATTGSDVPEKVVRNLMFRTSVSAPSASGVGYDAIAAAPSTVGNGFLFDDIAYGTSTESWTPEAPAHEPIVDGAVSIPTTEPLADGAVTTTDDVVTVDLGANTATREVGACAVDASGAAVFLGWAESDGRGAVTLPLGDLDAGPSSVVAYDSTSGLVGWASDAVTIDATEPTTPTTPTTSGPSALPTTVPIWRRHRIRTPTWCSRPRIRCIGPERRSPSRCQRGRSSPTRTSMPPGTPRRSSAGGCRLTPPVASRAPSPSLPDWPPVSIRSS